MPSSAENDLVHSLRQPVRTRSGFRFDAAPACSGSAPEIGLRPDRDFSLSISFRWRLAVLLALLAVLAPAVMSYRLLLRRVVQACVFDHGLTGSPFPCLRVETSDGVGRGYVVLRAPFQKTHIIVVPTAPIEGIESEQLQSRAAPNYAELAWKSRYLVQQVSDHPIADRELGLAVNSKRGRSQDQLHIHVSCVQQSFVRDFGKYDGFVTKDAWVRLPLAFRRRYWARRLPSGNLADFDVFAIAATLLEVSPGPLDQLTFAVLPAPEGAADGAWLLADQYTPGQRGSGHAEFLLDDYCSGD
jgi:CDP-diacylglycerol pyrophosphatase